MVNSEDTPSVEGVTRMLASIFRLRQLKSQISRRVPSIGGQGTNVNSNQRTSVTRSNGSKFPKSKDVAEIHACVYCNFWFSVQKHSRDGICQSFVCNFGGVGQKVFGTCSRSCFEGISLPLHLLHPNRSGRS
jgi:hypothetical protein